MNRGNRSQCLKSSQRQAFGEDVARRGNLIKTVDVLRYDVLRQSGFQATV